MEQASCKQEAGYQSSDCLQLQKLNLQKSLQMNKKELFQLVYQLFSDNQISEIQKKQLLERVVAEKEIHDSKWVDRQLTILRAVNLQLLQLNKNIEISAELVNQASQNFYQIFRQSIQQTVEITVYFNQSRSFRWYLQSVLPFLGVLQYLRIEVDQSGFTGHNLKQDNIFLAFEGSQEFKKINKIKDLNKRMWHIIDWQSPLGQFFQKQDNSLLVAWIQEDQIFVFQIQKKIIFQNKHFYNLISISEPYFQSLKQLIADNEQKQKNLLLAILKFLKQRLLVNKYMMCAHLIKFIDQKQNLFTLDCNKTAQISFYFKALTINFSGEIPNFDPYVFQTTFHKVKKRLLQTQTLYLNILKGALRQLLNQRHLYILFLSNQLIYISNLCQNPTLNSIRKLKKQQIKKMPLRKILRMLDIQDEQITKFQYQRQNQYLVNNHCLIIKENQLIELAVKLNQPSLQIFERNLSSIRRFNTNLNRSRLPNSRTDIRKTVVNQFLPQQQSAISKAGSKSIKFRKRTKVLQPATDPSILVDLDISQLKNFQNPNFNILLYDGQSDQLKYATYPFVKLQILEKYKIQMETWAQFVIQLIYHYTKNSNPFHNFYHAITVLNGGYHFSSFKKFRNSVNQLQKFAFLLSCLCHDVGHTGHTNLFQINSRSKLSIRYSDRSVLQNHHLATTFKILSQQQTNILKNLKIQEFSRFKRIAYQCIISTDNKLHFQKLNQFELFVKEFQENQSIIKEEVNLLLMLGLTTHTVDYYGNVKPFSISSSWVQLLVRQFNAQLQLQIQNNLPVTEYFRNLTDMPTRGKNQIGFISSIVQPLWKTINKWYDNQLQDQLQWISQNLQEWKRLSTVQ